MRKINIESRAQIGEFVSESAYASGLLRIIQYLFVDLSDLLEQEGRRFGIVISYLDSIYQSCKRMELSCDDETSEKIIYLFKPLIMSEYKRLYHRHISKADSVIVLIKRLLEIISEIDTFGYQKEITTLLKIINKLFNNIRNKGKFTNLGNMIETIQNYLSQGIIGKYGLDKFSLLEEKEKNRIILEGSGIRINKESSKILEVTWKDD